MTISNQEILRMLEYHNNPITELSAVIQHSQEKIKYIMEKESLSKPKDLITIARDFEELLNLNENQLNLRYLSKKYPDFKFSIRGVGIHATLSAYTGNTVAEFPPGLKDLSISDCENLERVPKLPAGLEELEIVNCENLETLAELSSSLERLVIEKCQKLTSLPSLPPSLEVLFLDCENIESIAELPEGLKVLHFKWCHKLKTIPKFPSSLYRIGFHFCKTLTNIPEFPPGLEILSIISCPNLNQKTLDRIEEFNKKQS